MSVVVGHDTIHANVGHLPPKGQTAGYTTGTPDIKWTAADWAAHGHAVRICQDAGSDETADVLDDENGAATDRDAAVWVPKAQAAYRAATRPGQRWPAVYKSASGITALVNTLIAHGIKSGVGLWIANWNLTDAQAVADVQNAAGPFPIVAVQFASGKFFDTNIFSSSWLGDVSKPKPTVHSHTTSAGDTVASLASARKMRPGSWLTLQEELGADVPALAAGALPAGLTWRSKNP